jgi:DNA invertase Pin-like site-specific DNA recombinase
MTQEQKRRITEMRKQNLGYAYIAKELDISLNTVKVFCRRNDLAGNRSTTDTHPKKYRFRLKKLT